MPPLSKMLDADVSKFSPVSVQFDIARVEAERNNLSTMRCPLPPINATPDTLRQFSNSGQTPQTRLIPLAAISNASSTKITNSTTISGSSSSSSSTVSFTALTATIATSSIVGGGSFIGTVTMAKSFQLLQLASDSPCNFRLYGSANAQALDSGRAFDTPVPAGQSSGIITDIVFDTAPYTWSWQNRTGANSDATQSTLLYVSVFNTDPTNSVSPSISILYLPLET